MDLKKVTDETYRDLGVNKKIDGVIDYDLIDNTSPDNMVNGKNPKKFVRMENKYFRKFFYEREKGEVSYSTCFTDEDDKMNYIPNYVPALVKMTFLSRDCVYETYVPEVLNHFNVQTVYNTLCQDEANYTYIASIDFIKPSERLVLFSEVDYYEGDFGRDLDLEESIEYFCRLVKKAYEKEEIQLTEIQLKEHIKEFVKSYLVRVCLLKDLDFNIRNCGLLFNDKEKQARLAPNFDFELCFRLQEVKNLKNDILYVSNEFPEIFDEFMKNLAGFTNKKDGVELYKLIYDEINGTEKYRETVFSIIEEQSKQILEIYENIKGVHFE